MIYIKSELVLLQMGANNIFCWSGAYDNCVFKAPIGCSCNFQPLRGRFITNHVIFKRRYSLNFQLKMGMVLLNSQLLSHVKPSKLISIHAIILTSILWFICHSAPCFIAQQEFSRRVYLRHPYWSTEILVSVKVIDSKYSLQFSLEETGLNV